MAKTYFTFLNSWGEEWGDPKHPGQGYLPADYAIKGYLGNPMVMIDQSNQYYGLLKKLIGLYKNLILKLKGQ
jgi:C1A family cysteine protease